MGSVAPDPEVHPADGSRTTLHTSLAGQPSLVVFYRGGWCPFCNGQIHDLRGQLPAFQARGVQLVLISVDRVDAAHRTRVVHELDFPVLADPDLAAHRAFRVTATVSDAEVARLKSMGMDIEASSGRDHHTIAVPSLFVVDADGVIAWSHADPDYKVRPTAAQILTALDALSQLSKEP